MADATPRSAQPLHPLEREVMQQLWQLGEAPVRTVMEAVNAEAPRARAYTTILTVLNRLETKRFVTRRRVGRGDVYRPTIAHEQWLREQASTEIDRLLDEYGDLALAHFAHEVDALDAGRRARLRELLDDA